MALSPILQIRRMIERGSSDDVSISYFAVLIIGFGLWIGYGLSREDAVLVVPNSIATVIALITVFIAWRYRSKASQGKGSDTEGHADRKAP